MNDIELPWSFYNMHGLEFNGQRSSQGRPLPCRPYYGGEPDLRARDHRAAGSPTAWRGLLRQRHHEVGCREFSTALTTVKPGARKTICCCRCADRDTLEEKAENKAAADCHGLKVDDKAPLMSSAVPTSQKGLDLVPAPPGPSEQAASWRYRAPAIRCCRKVSPPPPNTWAVVWQIGARRGLLPHRIMGGADVILGP